MQSPGRQAKVVLGSSPYTALKLDVPQIDTVYMSVGIPENTSYTDVGNQSHSLKSNPHWGAGRQNIPNLPRRKLRSRELKSVGAKVWLRFNQILSS